MSSVNNTIRIVKKIRKALLDLYCVSTFFFVLWMCLMDDQNIYAQYDVYKQCKKLESDRMYYTTHIQKIKKETKALLDDDELLEKLAREKYYMKRKQEDLYVIVQD